MAKFIMDYRILIKLTFLLKIIHDMNKKNHPNKQIQTSSSNFLILANKSELAKLKYLYFLFFVFCLFTTTNSIRTTTAASPKLAQYLNLKSKLEYNSNNIFDSIENESQSPNRNSNNNRKNLSEFFFLLKSNPLHASQNPDRINEYSAYEKETNYLHQLNLNSFLKPSLNIDSYDLSDAELYELLVKINKNNSLSDQLIEEISNFVSKKPQYLNYFLTNENMNLTSSSEWFNLSPQNKRLFNIIVVFLTSFICITGLIGNILSLKVFCSTKLPRTSSRIYLIALTVSDAIFLVTHFLDKTCKDIVDLWKIDFPLNITDQKQTMCRSFALLRNTCRAISPWLIVAFTVERFLVVIFPHHSSIISKPLLAKRFICIIITLSVLISLYAPILIGVTQTPKRKLKNLNHLEPFTTSPLYFNYLKQFYFKPSCDVLTSYRHIYLHLTFFYTFIVIIMPLGIVSVLNTILISRLYKSTDQWTRAKLELHEQELSYKEIRDKKMQVENFKVTWTLIIISVSFIFLTLPYVITYFIANVYYIKNSVQIKPLFLIQKITELMYILNHSINFFLYVVTRNSFRRVLKEKLQCDCFNLKSYMISNVNLMAKNHHHLSHNISSNDRKISASNVLSDGVAGGMVERPSLLEIKQVNHNVNINNNSSKKSVIDPQTYENYWDNFKGNSIKKNSIKQNANSENTKGLKIALLNKKKETKT
ncbi:unnamed protein product [Brachionus calyciflorus]|uniref:G-protein coupled receptors family 1 profile domain-containing protein n=1 Tax=Brachionus calyciflorus TaxID=104777 RepID=A0A813WJZ0_9BILA|nr:unnamed protein product [Brachionus calyciflorus]